MAERKELPAGFTLKTVGTSAGGTKYDVEVPQADSIDAVRAFYEAEGKNPDEVLLAIWNAGNEQGAKQGMKQAVRDAEGEEAQAAAIAAHQENARLYIQGAPRGGGGARHESGLTVKQRQEFGTKVAEAMIAKGGALSQKELDELAREMGIDLE